MVKKHNKVEYFGKVLIDLTEDSITPDKLLAGETAHDKTGNIITGTMQPLDFINVEIKDNVAVVSMREIS